MAYQRNFGMPEIVSQPPCMHLRSKAIYVTGNPDPLDPAEVGSHRYNCWCNRTQHVIGPDDQLVERADCVDGRGCFASRS
jgi:hypothetical protein